MDVTDRSSVEQAIGRAASELGQIDTLVNVAGGDIEHGTFEDTNDEVWTRVLELNLLGVRPLLPLGDSLPSAKHHEPGHRDRQLDQRLHRAGQ